MESQPQNPEFGSNPKNFRPCFVQKYIKGTVPLFQMNKDFHFCIRHSRVSLIAFDCLI